MSVSVSVVVEPMRRRHLRSVLRIERFAEHHGWSTGLFLSELRRADDRVYRVAKIGATVVGFGGLLIVEPDAHVTTLGVDPAWQRRGVGTRLMSVLIREAVRLGAENLTLEVRASNEAAVGLYRVFGLAPAGIRKSYYEDTGEDALIMWAHDINTPEYAQRLALVEMSIEGAAIVEEAERR